MEHLAKPALLRQMRTISRRYPRVTQRRLQSRRAHTDSHEQYRYQEVRFKRPGLSARRIATVGLYGGVVYAYFHLILRHLDVEIEVLPDDDEDRQTNTEDNEEDEEEDDGYADEDSTFIPLTWAKKIPRSFYKGSDPEWQEFIKVAKDKPRNTKIQDELVQVIYAGSVQHPSISRQLGKDTRIGSYWLDISFPDGPPQEYERSGIEIGDGFVAWSQQKISPEAQWRITRALWPKAAFDSLWATSRTLFGIQFRRLKQALGLEGVDPFSPEERFKHAMDVMQKQRQAREGKQVSGPQTDPGSESSAVMSNADARATKSAPPDEAGRFPWQISVPLPSNTGVTNSMDVPIALHVFQSTLSKSWHQKASEPPKGTFVVQGLVEVQGSRGRMQFDVKAFYDPKPNKFVAVNAAVRNFKRWNQSPRGGP